MIGAQQTQTNRVDCNARRVPADPRRSAIRARPGRTGAKPAAENPTVRNCVLLVDDQPSTLFLMRAMLERAAYAVVECLHGETAIDMLSNRDFDLVILDLNLSDMSGVALLRSSRLASAPLPPVLGITASPTSASIEQARQAGMCGVLSKPIGYEQLIEASGAAIAARGMRHIACEHAALDPAILSQIGATSDKRLVHRFVRQALADAQQCLRNLGAAVASCDLPLWRQHAQALAGVALTLGARRLAGAIDDALALPHKRLASTADLLTDRFLELLAEAKQSLLMLLRLLSDRERICLQLLGDGLSVKQIAKQLGITDRTVHFHLSNAASKLAARGQAHAVARALKLGAI